MTITVHLPNDLITHDDPAQEALEALAFEGYRTGTLSRSEAGALLKLGRLAFEALLKNKGIDHDAYGVDDLLEDIRTGDALRAEGRIPR